MPPFDSAPSFYKVSTLSRWYEDAVPELHDPELLWGAYWRRFNTMPVPILPYDAYFEKALEIAKLAKDKDEFERIFEERNSQAWKELQGFMLDAGYQTVYHKDIFTCEDALKKVDAVTRSGCLMDFIQLLKGSAFGWEADEVHETRIGNVPSGEGALVDAQVPVGTEYSDDVELFEPEMLDWEELVAKSRADRMAHGNDRLMQRDSAPSTPASNLGEESVKKTDRLQRKRKRVLSNDGMVHASERDRSSISRSETEGSVIGETSLLASDEYRGHKRQKMDDSTPISDIKTSGQPDESISRKRPICADEGDSGEQRHKRPKLNTPSQQHTQAETNASRINKRSTCHANDDDNDDDNDQQGHKRQKLDSSSQQHADAGSNGCSIGNRMSKKGSIRDHDEDNDDDNDDDEQRNKRQKLDSSSQQQAKADSNKSTIISKQRSSRNRRKRGSASSAPESIKTRSLNRIRPSTFWALDHTGKASIRI